MTLALAFIDKKEVFIIADTQLTPPRYKSERPFDGLKIFFLDRFTAIAYAGTAEEVAYSRLLQMYRMKATDNIPNIARHIVKNLDFQVDFLLAKAGSVPALFKVSSGTISKNSEGLYWIGSSDAANNVARGVHSTDVFELRAQFDEVVKASSFHTVGGHVVMARGTERGFRFVPEMQLNSPAYVPKAGLNTVDFGTAATGGFGYTTIVPKGEGVNGWGVYYFQGKFGKYFHVDFERDIREILIAHANTAEEFMGTLEQEIGISVEHCGGLGSVISSPIQTS